MEISAGKSKIHVTSKEEVQLEEPILVSGEELEKVNNFKYFGNLFSYDLNSFTDIKSSIAIATAAMVKLNPILKNRKIKIKTKLRFMRAIVISTMTYR